jgi:hypothetical protein
MDKPPETYDGTNLPELRRRVIACATVMEEILPFLPGSVTYEILDFGLHLHPGELKNALQEKVNEASQNADVLLLGYGLCSMAVVGLHATTATLIIPRVDDCISIFLGSGSAYRQQARQEPGTYYLTKGWIEVGDSPFEEYARLAKKYGEAKSKRMIGLALKNYTRLAFINTGQYEIERYKAYAQRMADQFGLRYEEIAGSPALVKKLIFGPWDKDFVVVRPGQTVQYQDFTPSASDGKK